MLESLYCPYCKMNLRICWHRRKIYNTGDNWDLFLTQSSCLPKKNPLIKCSHIDNNTIFMENICFVKTMQKLQWYTTIKLAPIYFYRQFFMKYIPFIILSLYYISDGILETPNVESSSKFREYLKYKIVSTTDSAVNAQ